MMKFLKNHSLLLLAAVGGVAVMILRFIHLATANEFGLLASNHFAGILTVIISVAIPAVLLWRSLVLPKDTVCRFPASTVAAVGCGIGALGIAYTAVVLSQNSVTTLSSIVAVLGAIAALALLGIAFCRFKGLAANVLYHGAVCLFFIVLLLCQYQLWSSVPQLQLYIYSILATIALMIGGYHRACFDGKMGQLPLYTFFRCVSIFFCLAAIPGCDLWILYLAGAVWSATDILNLSAEAPVPDAPEEGG